MDIERIQKLIANPKISRLALEQQMQQALKVNERDLAFDIQEIIDERFGFKPAASDKHGSASASFHAKEKSFDHAKDAYLWLIERFIEIKPDILVERSWETTGVIAVGRARGRAGKPLRNYFAKSPEKLFPETPRLAEKRSNYAKLQNGWYANINLGNHEKLDILIRFGDVLHLAHETDWRFIVQNPSTGFQARLTRPNADDLLAELDGLEND